MTDNQGEQLSRLISTANAITNETLAAFGSLAAEQLNWKPKVTLFVAMLLSLAAGALGNTTRSQSCNPAVVSYLVRDERGQVLSAAELKAVYEQLPKSIGDARLNTGEVSFAADSKSYYWPEDVGWQQGRKVPALQFANAESCAMQLTEVTLEYNNQRMRLIFNLNVTRTRPDRRLVVDALPFQPGTFTLDVRDWPHHENEMISAERWQRAPDSAVFTPVLPELLQRTRVPLRLPTYLAADGEAPLYAIIEEATPTYFDVRVSFCPDFPGGKACGYGFVIGQAHKARGTRLKGKAVKLAWGITGYTVDAACGDRCWSPILSWVQHGYRYTLGIGTRDLATQRRVANSAIRNSVVKP